MKTLFFASILILGLALTSSAVTMQTIQETFQSGAVFNGTITFTGDFSSLTAVDGWLTGGTYGNDHLTWIWAPGTNFAASLGPHYGGNFLMDGTDSGNYQNFITLTWDFSGAPNVVIATPGPILDPTGGNNVSYKDPLVSGSISGPEPATLALLGGGLIGFGLLRRRKTVVPR